MVPLLKVLGTFLIGFAALASLFWGWILWLPLAAGMGAEWGGLWQVGAFAALLAVNVAVTAGLWRLQDDLVHRLDFRGRALEERRYCQRCGAAHPSTAPACNVCGTVRLGLTPPVRPRAPTDAHGHAALRER
jgi:ribosomal protein L40E